MGYDIHLSEVMTSFLRIAEILKLLVARLCAYSLPLDPLVLEAHKAF